MRENENVVKLLGYIEDPLSIVMVKYDINLFSLLHEWKRFSLQEISVMTGCSIAIDIANGMAALHSASIIHLDLKSSNILLLMDYDEPETYRAVISDFGKEMQV